MAKRNPKLIPHLTQKDINRFWSKVDKTPGQGPQGECWEWTGDRRDEGYGRFGITRNTLPDHLVASRVAFFLATGDDPDGLLVLHRCDNPPCCNPIHLFLGTHQDNSNDCITKGRDQHPSGNDHPARRHPERMARGDRNGSRLHPERMKRGEEVCTAKLTVTDVAAIRAKYATGKYTQQELAIEYHCGHSNISMIVRGASWQHI